MNILENYFLLVLEKMGMLASTLKSPFFCLDNGEYFSIFPNINFFMLMVLYKYEIYCFRIRTNNTCCTFNFKIKPSVSFLSIFTQKKL